MTPLEFAMKLASASSKCEKHKCPFMSQCKGEYTSCTMKEIAMILRAQAADIDTKDQLIKALQAIIETQHSYIEGVEKINKRYHDLVDAFYHGYRPKKKPSGKRGPYKPRKKRTPEEMDGDKRFAFNPDPPREEFPLVVI